MTGFGKMRIDTHIHSVHSGHAALRARDIIGFSKKNNIVPALTDHNTTKGWNSFAKEAKKAGIPFILGEEIKVYEAGKCKGELLGLFLQEEVKQGEIGEVLDGLGKQGALVSVAHPFDFLRKALFCRLAEPEEFLKKADAVEVYNSRSWFRSANWKAEEFARNCGKPFTAGTDAHFSIELGNAFLEIDAGSLEEARKKILKGKCSFQGRMSPRRIHVYTQLAKLGFFK